ncbi:MAG: hypothetical protein K2N38_00515 [Oscillospiraceae bacterium]|nr:hypothetical protein [Oscillospiraceae bacterium]
MLKKILAASSAAVVALSALASTAMAATNDDYTIVIENVNDYKMVTLDLTASLSQNQIKDLLGANREISPLVGEVKTSPDMYDTAKDSENSYANMILSVWMANFTNLQGRDSDFKTADRDDGKSGGYSWEDVVFNGATISVDLEANVQKKFVVKSGYVLPAGGPGIPESYAEDYPDADYEVGGDGLVLDVGRKGGAAGYGWKNSKLETESDNKTLVEDPKNNSTGPDQVSFEKEATISKNAAWKNFDSLNGGVNGHVVTPAAVKGTFGLSDIAILDEILYNKSKVTVDFSVSMPEREYYGMVYGTQATGYYWDWTDKCWRDTNGNKVTNFTEILNGGNTKDAINSYFGVVGQSYGRDSGKVYGGVDAGVEVKVKNIVAEDVHKVNPLSLDAWYRVGLGMNATPTRLKNMNNGGTIEFVFKNEVWAGSFLSVETILRSGSGIAAVPLTSEFAFAESGKSVSVPFPAGMTGEGLGSSQTNPFNSFWLDYMIKGTSWVDPSQLIQLDQTHGWTGVGSANPTQWNNELVQIIIHANKEAPKTEKPADSSSNGGLVEKPDNSTSTPSTSTPASTNNGGTSNNEKNPGTGVAVAVAPVVLATAAAAVVISKKRK